MTKEVEFLKDLQQQLKSQPNDGNASPVLWVVGDYKWVVKPEGCGCRISIHLPDSDNDFSMNEYRENILDGSDEVDLEGEDFIDLYNATKDHEIKGWIEDHETRSYNLFEESKDHIIKPDTFFITKDACQKHIENNSHHYTSQVHTFAMTAWRSPQVEELWDMLENFDWEKVEKALELQQIKVGDKIHKLYDLADQVECGGKRWNRAFYSGEAYGTVTSVSECGNRFDADFGCMKTHGHALTHEMVKKIPKED